MQIKTFKPNVSLTVDINTNMIPRIQELVMAHVNQRTPEQIQATTKKIQEEDEDLDEWEEHYVTLLVLLQAVEEQAATQDALVDVELPATQES